MKISYIIISYHYKKGLRMNYNLPLQKALIFIEDNIANDITIEDLASMSGYSLFHFHRMFRSVTGESIMEYIKRKRILYAAGDLMGTASTITDIAQKYDFGSHDVFTRAFRRFLAVTPSEYRKINSKLNKGGSTNQKDKEVLIQMLDYTVYERMKCSNEEKRRCIPLIEFILKLSEKARKNGLLSLEGSDKNHMFFIRKTLELLLDGVEPGYIRHVMMNYIHVGNYEGIELLERILALEGLLAIQAGEHPLLLFQKLLSYLGEEMSQEVEALLVLPYHCDERLIDDFNEKVKNKKPMTAATALLEDPVGKLDKRSLQRMLRDVAIEDIACALKGAGRNTVIRVLQCLPKKSALIIVKELDSNDLINPQSIIESQKRMIEIILKLRSEGEIK